MPPLSIRRASVEDAAGISATWEPIVAERGRLLRQVKLDGEYEDEILMEVLLK